MNRGSYTSNCTMETIHEESLLKNKTRQEVSTNLEGKGTRSYLVVV